RRCAYADGCLRSRSCRWFTQVATVGKGGKKEARADDREQSLSAASRCCGSDGVTSCSLTQKLVGRVRLISEPRHAGGRAAHGPAQREITEFDSIRRSDPARWPRRKRRGHLPREPSPIVKISPSNSPNLRRIAG